jgi:hypothetical protein
VTRLDPRDLRDARANLEAYRRRFTTQHSAMHAALGVALQCIDNECARETERRQLTIEGIS